jgi:hypothetical protein
VEGLETRVTTSGPLTAFRTQVQALQRQGWALVHYSEDPPMATLDQTIVREQRSPGSRFAEEALREHHRRTVWIDDAGELHDEPTIVR